MSLASTLVPAVPLANTLPLASMRSPASLTALESPASAVPRSSFTWPLPGRPPVLRRFLPPPTPYAPGHRGVDLGAAVGTPVLAAGAGVIGFAGPLAGRGVVTVIFDGGLRTTYEPVRAIVRPGDRVALGQQIGWLAAPTGHCGPGTACLHWGLLRGSVYLDPLTLLGASPVRLFPLARESLPAGPPPPSDTQGLAGRAAGTAPAVGTQAAAGSGPPATRAETSEPSPGLGAPRRAVPAGTPQATGTAAPAGRVEPGTEGRRLLPGAVAALTLLAGGALGRLVARRR